MAAASAATRTALARIGYAARYYGKDDPRYRAAVVAAQVERVRDAIAQLPMEELTQQQRLDLLGDLGYAAG